MGIELSAAEYLIDRYLAIGGPKGRCLTLGKQEINFTFKQLARIMHERQLLSVSSEIITVDARQQGVLDDLQQQGRLSSRYASAADRGCISDDLFFRFIGFDEIHSVDMNAFEGADFSYDLNEPQLAGVVGTEYDTVIDAGTLEHIFLVNNVLRNMFEVTKPGGTLVHITPANNYVEHGFYQLSPTFFFDYYHANGFENILIDFFRHSTNPQVPWMWQRYSPSTFAPCVGALDDQLYGTCSFAKKTEGSHCDRIPQQSFYRKIWSAKGM